MSKFRHRPRDLYVFKISRDHITSGFLARGAKPFFTIKAADVATVLSMHNGFYKSPNIRDQTPFAARFTKLKKSILTLLIFLPSLVFV